MKRIYLFIAALAVAGSVSAQKSADLELVKSSWGLSASNLKAYGANDSLLLNADAPLDFYFAWDIKNNGPDSLTAADTIKINPWWSNTDFRFFLDTNVFRAGKTYTGIHPVDAQNNAVPVPLVPPASQGSSGVVVITGCDTVFIKSTIGTTDPQLWANNQKCANIALIYWVTGIGYVPSGLEGVALYPNPSTNKMNLLYEFQTNTSASVRVVDATGRLVHTQDFGKQTPGMKSFQLNFGNLAAGTYNLQLMTGEGVSNKQFTIIK